MGDLELMSNDELRVELQRYGFQNIPLTQTTRKVLIKKLKVAIDSQKNQNRRQTIAITKASDDDDIPLAEIARSKKEKTPNRRATVAVVEKSKSITKTTSSQNGDNKSPSRRSSRATPTPARPNYALQDQSDDDVIEIIDEPVTRRSKSKTPTLSKSETVRTSHFTSRASKERIIPVVREEDVSTEEEERSPEIEFQAPRPVVTRRTTTTLSYNNKPSNFATRTSSISTSYNPTGNYSALSNDYEEDNSEDLNAPYLSNFAKRLSTLKAEPLDSGINKYKKDLDYDKIVPSTSNYRYSSSTTSNYSKPARADTGVLKGIANKYDKLDRSYNINRFVYAILLIMIIVAVYVLFFT